MTPMQMVAVLADFAQSEIIPGVSGKLAIIPGITVSKKYAMSGLLSLSQYLVLDKFDKMGDVNPMFSKIVTKEGVNTEALVSFLDTYFKDGEAEIEIDPTTLPYIGDLKLDIPFVGGFDIAGQLPGVVIDKEAAEKLISYIKRYSNVGSMPKVQ